MDVETSPQRGISISCLQPPLIRSIYLPFTKARCEALPRHTSSATPHRPGSKYLISGKKNKDMGHGDLLKNNLKNKNSNLMIYVWQNLSVFQWFSREHIDEDCGFNYSRNEWK